MQTGRGNGPERRDLRCIDTLFFKGFYDDVTGFHSYSPLISASVILRVQGMVPRNSRRGWCRLLESTDPTAPNGGVARVRMHNAANGGECLISSR